VRQGTGACMATISRRMPLRRLDSTTPRPGRKRSDIADVDPAHVRKRLGLLKGALDVLVGGPPCQGFSINAPANSSDYHRNALFERKPLRSTPKMDVDNFPSMSF